MSSEKTAEMFKDKSEEEIINWMLKNLTADQIKSCFDDDQFKTIDTSSPEVSEVQEVPIPSKPSKPAKPSKPSTIVPKLNEIPYVSNVPVEKVVTEEDLPRLITPKTDKPTVFRAVQLQQKTLALDNLKELFTYAPVLITNAWKDKVWYFYLSVSDGKFKFVRDDDSIDEFENSMVDIMNELQTQIQNIPTPSDDPVGYLKELHMNAYKDIPEKEINKVNIIYSTYPLQNTNINQFLMDNLSIEESAPSVISEPETDATSIAESEITPMPEVQVVPTPQLEKIDKYTNVDELLIALQAQKNNPVPEGKNSVIKFAPLLITNTIQNKEGVTDGVWYIALKNDNTFSGRRRRSFGEFEEVVEEAIDDLPVNIDADKIRESYNNIPANIMKNIEKVYGQFKLYSNEAPYFM